MPPTHPSQADVAAAYRTLIAHETEPKEQDFYRTRLQRLEQATEPECEFDCRRRVAAAGVGVYCPQCSAKCADTDLTTNLAKAIRAAWVDRLDWDELAHAALKFLTSTGRLIPAGGRGLEFSEVEALRSAWEELKGYRVDGYARPYVNQMVKVVGALFPATEPTDEVTQAEGFCSFCGWSRDACARGEGDCAPAEPAEVSGNIFAEGNSSPTVVHVHHHDIESHAASFTEGFDEAVRQLTEPAEEETKAEGPCEVQSPQGDTCSFPKPGHAGVHTWAWPDKKPAGEGTRAECVGDDYYCAQRDSAGNIRLNCGRGLLVAEAACTVNDVKEWWARADRGSKWERQYQAALDLFDREAASSPVVPASTETGPRYCSSCKLNVPPAPYCTNCGGDTIPRSPTETGPWPSLLAVPVTVQKVKDAKGYEWHRRGSTDGWRGCNGADAYTSNCRTGHRDSAPFVAAEEG